MELEWGLLKVPLFVSYDWFATKSSMMLGYLHNVDE